VHCIPATLAACYKCCVVALHAGESIEHVEALLQSLPLGRQGSRESRAVKELVQQHDKLRKRVDALIKRTQRAVKNMKTFKEQGLDIKVVTTRGGQQHLELKFNINDQEAAFICKKLPCVGGSSSSSSSSSDESACRCNKPDGAVWRAPTDLQFMRFDNTVYDDVVQFAQAFERASAERHAGTAASSDDEEISLDALKKLYGRDPAQMEHNAAYVQKEEANSNRDAARYNPRPAAASGSSSDENASPPQKKPAPKRARARSQGPLSTTSRR
jgi:hypothetical protein